MGEVMEPTTELDREFSDPDASATDWNEVRDALAAAEIFWIATVRRDGRPHVTPLVAVWLDESLYFCTGPAEQKAVNLRDNPQVILSTGCNGWESGLDVIVEGTARRVTDAATLERLTRAWRSKWDGRWHFEVDADGFRHEEGLALVFEVAPTKVLSFAKAPFAASRHCFRKQQI
jgi:nitroimidazol reductase NimA-like FMN-containing flavoprotein (pyridoxamine 5'-phosphate oxidase superfamily)